MNILTASNYTVGSSYAYQMRMFAPAFRRLGHKVTVFDIRNGGGSTASVDGFTILPAANDPVGNDILPDHFKKSRADMLLTLCDVWGFHPEAMSKCYWCPLAPIDHSPVPPACVSSLKAAKVIIAITRFGQKELEKAGFPSLYWPLVVDPAVWYPGDKRQAREAVAMPQDTFVASFVGVNDSNPSRKGIPELLAAWKLFTVRHPSAKLYLHTLLYGNIPVAGARNGVDIPTLIKTFDIDPTSVIIVDQYRMRTGVPASELATVARASDVFILPSRGEGFGLPLIEFQRAACPVITTDFGGGAELCGSGWLIDGEIEWSWQNSTVLRPGIASIVDNLEKAFEEKDNPIHKRRALEFARDFELEYVVQKYVGPILEQIGEYALLSGKVA